MAWNIGDIIRLRVTCNDIDGDLSTPLTISLSVVRPNLVQEDYVYPGDIDNESLGVYYYDYPITDSGKYCYIWTTTGIPTRCVPGDFTVSLSRLP